MRAHGALCLLGASVLSTSAALGSGLPFCVPHRDTGSGKVVRVDSLGALVLADGRVVKLEGLRLPGVGERAPEAFRHRVLTVLSALARTNVTIATCPPREDRYGRIRAQVLLSAPKQIWLQEELLKRGLARVSIAPDRRECARALYAAEQSARMARAGIWGSPAYAIRSPTSISGADLGTFQIVEGEVLNAAVRGGRAYLNFGRNWRTDFTVTISPQDMKSFTAAGIDPRSYAGKRVRVHGSIERMNGPEIEAAVPEAIEIVSSASPGPAQDGAR